MRQIRQTVATVQGIYYVLTGIWSLVSIRSFEAITGPKADRWLVKTVGVLVIAIGVTLLRTARRSRPMPDVALLGAGTAAGLAAIDVAYVAKGRISRVYLLDAAAEAALVAAWVVAQRQPRPAGRLEL